MRSRLSLVALPVTAAALMLASGCGGDDNKTASAETATSAGGQTVNVSETDYKLDPSDPTVQSGTVSFEVTNDGGVAHNLEVEGPKGEVELEQDIGPGESDTLTVDLSTPGRYEFYCPVDGHRDLGMEGEITVTGGGGTGGGGAEGAGASGSGDDSSGGGVGSGYGY
jgi:uncharacterized cupredoxin-like copper-binding protein